MFDSSVARILAGTITVAAALLHLPLAAADGTGSATAPPDLLQAIPFGPPAPLGYRGADTAIVVLGYGLLPDGTMRPELIDRLHTGFVQALLAPSSPIIVTGGNPRSGITEAQAMADWLIGHGIAADRIIVEPAAVSTRENAEHSARIMHEIGARDAVVVTSRDHADRATALFRDAGVAVATTLSPDQVPQLVLPFGPKQ